jgi:hypothetical protein
MQDTFFVSLRLVIFKIKPSQYNRLENNNNTVIFLGGKQPIFTPKKISILNFTTY